MIDRSFIIRKKQKGVDKQMRSFYAKVTVTAAILILSLNVSVLGEANLLLNPSFESPEGAGFVPSSWSVNGISYVVNAKTDTDYAMSGNQSVRLHAGSRTGGSGSLRQRVAGINPGDNCIAEVRAIITDFDLTAGASIGLFFEGRDPYYGNYETLEYIGGESIDETMGGYRKLTVSGIAPPGTEAVSLSLGISGWRDGTANFDDAYLIAVSAPVPEPSSLVLLSVGLSGLFIISRKKKVLKR